MISSKTHFSAIGAARQLGVRVATLDEMIERGLLTAIRIPGSITRIPKAEVEALIARSTRVATAKDDSTSAA